MTKAIGQTFASEIVNAGITDLRFAWDEYGNITFDPRVPAEVIDAVESVYEAHDPTRKLAIVPAPLTPRQWLDRLTTDKQAAIFAAAATNAQLLGLVIYATGGPTLDPTDPRTAQGVNAFVASGVLTQEDGALLLAP